MAVKVTTRKPGFASMAPERQRESARRGGQTTQRLGKAHKFTPEEAREAGKKGGLMVSRNRAYMAEIGRKGGASARERRSAAIDHNRKEH